MPILPIAGYFPVGRRESMSGREYSKLHVSGQVGIGKCYGLDV